MADSQARGKRTKKEKKASEGPTPVRAVVPKPEGYVEEADRWEYLFVAKQQGFPVSAVVDRVSFPRHLDSAVWELDLGDGIRGIVPFSESGLSDAALMARFVGQAVAVRVKSLDRGNGLAACSREEAVAEARRRLLAALAPGQVIDAVVRTVLPRSASDRPARLLLDIGGGVLAEVPRSAATRSRVGKLAAHFCPGQQVRVVVKEFDAGSGAVGVSLAGLEGDPWAGADYRRGEIVCGRIVSRRDSVLFVEVRPGVVGIANVPLRAGVRHGDRVSAKVTMCDPEKKRLHLRLLSRLA